VLGIVTFGDQRQFPVEVVASASYRLVAEGGAEPIETRDFLLRPGDVVEWNLFSGTVSRRDD
jgi:hypothetical protein